MVFLVSQSLELSRYAMSKPPRGRSCSRRPSRIAKSLCLLVALFFAGRVGVGLLAPDAFDKANKACETHVESSIEDMEIHDDIEVFKVAALDVMPAASITPSLSTIVELSRSIASSLPRPLPSGRGPPA